MFADAFGFDISFLITGKGELFPQRPAIKQTIVGENNTQVAEVGGNGGDCPSMADLLAKVASLERINKAKDSEITFLVMASLSSESSIPSSSATGLPVSILIIDFKLLSDAVFQSDDTWIIAFFTTLL